MTSVTRVWSAGRLLAVRPLARALELAPDAAPVLSELVSALERDGQHARAVAVLEEHEPVMQLKWLPRFQYVYNALMAGDLEKAAEGFGRLPEPEDTAGAPAREKVRRILARAGTARSDVARPPRPARLALRPDRRCPGNPVTVRVRRWDDRPLGLPQRLRRRLRGRAAAAPADPGCRRHPPGGGGAAARPLEPDPAAAAAVLGLPATDFDSGNPAANCLVVGYNLTRTDPGAVAALRERAPGQVLFERATCWTDPPRVTADVSGLLAQTVVTPWAAQMRRFDDGAVGQRPADDRPADAVAAEIARAMPEPDEDDGSTPRTPTRACAASSRRSRPQVPATAAGSAASASTFPTPARCPAAASVKPARVRRRRCFGEIAPVFCVRGGT